MALKGQAKKDYQREYMRHKRSNKTSVRPVLDPAVRPIVQPDKQETLSNLRKLIGSVETKQDVKPSIPLYNSAIHKPGDRVLMKQPYSKKLVEVVIPELDSGGQPVPGYW